MINFMIFFSCDRKPNLPYGGYGSKMVIDLSRFVFMFLSLFSLP